MTNWFYDSKSFPRDVAPTTLLNFMKWKYNYSSNSTKFTNKQMSKNLINYMMKSFTYSSNSNKKHVRSTIVILFNDWGSRKKFSYMSIVYQAPSQAITERVAEASIYIHLIQSALCLG